MKIYRIQMVAVYLGQETDFLRLPHPGDGLFERLNETNRKTKPIVYQCPTF